jgi:hypothetical protein
MIRAVWQTYFTLLKGLFVLGVAGALSSAHVESAARTAAQSVRTGLMSLRALNQHLGF